MNQEIEKLKRLILVLEDKFPTEETPKILGLSLFLVIKMLLGEQKDIDSLNKRQSEILEIITNDTKFENWKREIATYLETESKHRESVIKQTLDKLPETIEGSVEKEVSKNERRFEKLIDKLLSQYEKKLEDVKNKVDSIKVKDGEDGKTPTKDELVSLIEPLIPKTKEATPETAEDIRNKLEILQGDERLKKEAVKGIEEIENDIKEIKGKQIQIRGGGGKGIQLYVDGSRKGLTSQAINLIAGTGVTLTYSYSYGRNDVTISTSGGGFLAATGTVNGTNLDFTFSSAPSIIVVDGVPRQKTQSDGTVNWTGTTSITLVVAPTFDVYGVA